MTFDVPSFVEGEWTNSYEPKHVDDPIVGCIGVDDLYDIIGR
jgi:hypothetical protein